MAAISTGQLIGVLLAQLALIARDPALGVKGAAITEALALIGSLIEKGEQARAELEALAAHVRAMAEADRPPNLEEWGGLRDLSRQYHEELNPPIADEKTE